MFAARREGAAAKGLALVFAGAPGCGVRGDAQLLAILLDNLVANAIRYSEWPGEVLVAVQREGEALVLSVQDHGVGIAADRLPLIWERFSAPTSRAAAAGGSGLGLSIVRAIAERHGATCRASSEIGDGTRTEVVFPADRVCASNAPAAGFSRRS